MKSARWFVIGGVACAACCAPLLAPLLAWAGLAGVGAALGGWASGLDLERIACVTLGVVLVGALAVMALRVWRRRRAAPSCEVGGPCDPSASSRRENEA